MNNDRGALDGCQHYKPLQTNPLEIRLLDLQPGQWAEQVRCTIRHVSLHDTPRYETLSYAWGAPDQVRLIQLGGCQHAVTVNLESALRHLRYQLEVRTLWVDALCINQADLAERTSQVLLMFDIYSKASNSIAWTGEASDDSLDALELIKSLASFIRRTFYQDPEAFYRLEGTYSSRYTRMGFPMATQDWSSLWNFFDRPYWSRIWVVQELAARCFLNVEKPCIVHCGSNTISLSDYDAACTALIIVLTSSEIMDRVANDLAEPHRSLIVQGRSIPLPGIAMFQAIAICKAASGAPQPSLRSLFRVGRQFQASDDHDKVYALLNLAPVSDKAVVPDYEKPVKRMMIGYVKFFIQKDRDLASIYCNRSRPCLDCPTWTPEIHNDHQAADMWESRLLDDHFNAGSVRECSVDVDEEHGILRSKGVLIGTVSKAIGPLREEMLGLDKVSNVAEASLKLGHQKIFDQLIAFASELDDKAYDAFWRALTLDREEERTLGPAKSPASPEKGVFSRVFFKLAQIPESFHPELPSKARFGLYTSPFTTQMLSAISNRTFFTTTMGLMCLGPYMAQPSDLITVLYGAKRCFVLRPRNAGGYFVVGDAYVHGVMGGELFSDLSLDETVFEIF